MAREEGLGWINPHLKLFFHIRAVAEIIGPSPTHRPGQHMQVADTLVLTKKLCLPCTPKDSEL